MRGEALTARKAPVAPAMPPASSSELSEFWPWLSANAFFRFAYSGKKISENGTSLISVAPMPVYAPRMPRLRTTWSVVCCCSTGSVFCICMRILISSIGVWRAPTQPKRTEAKQQKPRHAWVRCSCTSQVKPHAPVKAGWEEPACYRCDDLARAGQSARKQLVVESDGAVRLLKVFAEQVVGRQLDRLLGRHAHQIRNQTCPPTSRRTLTSLLSAQKPHRAAGPRTSVEPHNALLGKDHTRSMERAVVQLGARLRPRLDHVCGQQKKATRTHEATSEREWPKHGPSMLLPMGKMAVVPTMPAAPPTTSLWASGRFLSLAGLFCTAIAGACTAADMSLTEVLGRCWGRARDARSRALSHAGAAAVRCRTVAAVCC